MPRARRRPTVPSLAPDGLARPRLEPIRIADPARDPATGAPLGGEVVVMRRAPARVLARFPASRREAAEVFAATLERVEAGGVNASPEAGALAGGGGASDCRQMRALRDAEALRRMCAAIGRGAVPLTLEGGRGATLVADVALVRAVVVEGESLGAILARMGAPGRRNEVRARDALFAALGRVAVVLGLEPEPKPEHGA